MALKSLHARLEKLICLVFLFIALAGTALAAEIDGLLGIKLGQTMETGPGGNESDGSGLAEVHVQPPRTLQHFQEYTAYVERGAKRIAKLGALSNEIAIGEAETLFTALASTISRKYGPMIPIRIEPLPNQAPSIQTLPGVQTLRVHVSARSITLKLIPIPGRRIKVAGRPEEPPRVIMGKVSILYTDHQLSKDGSSVFEISPDDI